MQNSRTTKLTLRVVRDFTDRVVTERRQRDLSASYSAAKPYRAWP